MDKCFCGSLRVKDTFCDECGLPPGVGVAGVGLRLNWGEDIPADIMSKLRVGEVATLHDENGKPHSLVMMDSYGLIREKMLRRD